MKNNEISPSQKILTLIDSEFSPEDATKILLSIVNHKIKYHEVEVFSSEIRFGASCNHSEVRVKALKKVAKQLNDIMKQAISENKRVKVHSEIKVEFI